MRTVPRPYVFRKNQNFEKQHETKISDQNFGKAWNPRRVCETLEPHVLCPFLEKQERPSERKEEIDNAGKHDSSFEDLRCSACAAKAMVENQGIETLDDLCFLKDGDVETLCKIFKCPGGTAGGTTGEPTWDIWSAKRLR